MTYWVYDLEQVPVYEISRRVTNNQVIRMFAAKFY